MLKVFLLRAGENDMLLEIAGKAVLVNMVEKNLAELCPMFIWKAELASDELN